MTKSTCQGPSERYTTFRPEAGPLNTSTELVTSLLGWRPSLLVGFVSPLISDGWLGNGWRVVWSPSGLRNLLVFIAIGCPLLKPTRMFSFCISRQLLSARQIALAWLLLPGKASQASDLRSWPRGARMLRQ